MNTELDSLELRVQSDSQSASAGLDSLISSLTQLKSAAKGGAGLTSVVNQVTKLSQAVGALKNNSALSGLAAALQPLQSVEKAAGFASTVNALKKIPQLTKDLGAADIAAFADQIQRITQVMAPLATEMEKVSRGFAAFPIRIQKIIASNSGLSASNRTTANSFNLLNKPITSAIAALTAYGYAVHRVVSFLADAVTYVNEYVENVNLFQVSMGEYYQQAADYAALVSDRLGIDPSEWMRTQGVFMSIANGFGVARDQAYALSEGLTELSYDLSSLYNEDVETSALRLQSALAGEIEPIRRLGIAISEASLKEFALAKGIDKSVESMTEQEKALLRTLKLMEGAANIGAIGDFAKTLESPANALRVLNQQITQFKRAIGSVLLPLIVQVLPYLQAVVLILTDIINAVATLLGFTIPQWDDEAWGSGIAAGAGDATSALGETADAIKEIKNATMGFDELNIISPPDSGSGSGAGADWAAGVEVPNVWDQEAIEAIKTKANELKEKLQPIVTPVLAIGAGFLAWKIGNSIFKSVKNLGGLLNTLAGNPLLKSFVSWITGNLVGMTVEFNAAGGGASGFLAVLKSLAISAGPVIAVLVLIGATLKVLVERWDDIKIAIQNIFEKLNISEKLQSLQSKLDEVGQKLGWVNGFWQGLKDTIGVVIDFIGGWVITVLGSLLIGAFNGLIAVIEGAITAVSGVLDIFSGLATFLEGVFTLDLAKVQDGLGQMAQGVKTAFSGLWQMLTSGVSEFIAGFLASFSELGGTLISEKLPAILQGFQDWWGDVVNFFVAELPKWWAENIAPWFSAEKWIELGKSAMEGLFQGLASIGEAASEWGSDLIASVKEVLGIHSPSTVFESLGVYAIDGLRIGLNGITFMSSLFGNQLTAMKQLAYAFFSQLKAMQDTALAAYLAVLEAAGIANAETTDVMAAAYEAMAARSNAAIQSIIDYLDSIPRNITTVHTIITRTVSGGSGGGGSGSVSGYASGGFPTQGQLFLAREAGPELVGTLGGRVAVANNDQIVQGIAQGVYDAMVRAAQVTSTDGQPIVIELSGEKIGRSVTNWQQRQGVSVTKGAYAYVY